MPICLSLYRVPFPYLASPGFCPLLLLQSGVAARPARPTAALPIATGAAAAPAVAALQTLLTAGGDTSLALTAATPAARALALALQALAAATAAAAAVATDLSVRASLPLRLLVQARAALQSRRPWPWA